MGLTGLIVRAVIQLKRVATSRVEVDTVRTADIDETMAVLATSDRSFGYTVAWSDSLALGARLGRSVVTSGDFAEPADLPPAGMGGPSFRVPAGRPPGRPARVPARADQPLHRRAGQRGLVPQGAPLPAGRAADHRDVRPARRDQELEPGVRTRRLPAVPVRPAVRPGGRRAPLLRAGLLAPPPS